MNTTYIPLPERESRSPLWWLRFRLWGLFVLTVLVAVATVTATRWWNAYSMYANDKDIVAQLSVFGAEASFSSRFGFGRVRTLCFTPSVAALDNDQLKMLTGLDELRAIRLEQTAVTDDGLRHLYPVPNLKHLNVDRRQISVTAVEEFTQHRPDVTVTPKKLLTREQIQAVAELERNNFDLNDRELTAILEWGILDLGTRRRRKVTVSPRAIECLAAFRRNLVSLDLNTSGLGDATAAALPVLESLVALDLTNAQITDDGLAHLGKLKNLQELNLSLTRVTRYAVARLQDVLPECKITWVGGIAPGGKHLSVDEIFDLPVKPLVPQTSDISFVHLREPVTVVSLSCFGTKITDRGLQLLGKHATSLHTLEIVLNPLRGEGFQFFQDSESLRRVQLMKCPVNDDGLAHIAKLPALEVLDLRWTQVTDAGLQHLHAHPTLRELDLRGTAVTAEGVATLEQHLPDCHIVGP